MGGEDNSKSVWGWHKLTRRQSGVLIQKIPPRLRINLFRGTAMNIFHAK